MTLPERGGKEYLELATASRSVFIEGLAQHLAELEDLLTQRGIPCRLVPTLAGEQALLLGRDADRAAAQEVLDSYKAAKGS